MDEKKLKSSVKTIDEICSKTFNNKLAEQAIYDKESSLNRHISKCYNFLSHIKNGNDSSFRLFSKLMNSDERNFKLYKSKVQEFINNNLSKFGLYLSKYTKFGDINNFMDTKSGDFVKSTIELVLCCQLYKQNLKILYYQDEKIKEKNLKCLSKI